MWKKEYHNANEEVQIAHDAKLMMARLEQKAYSSDSIPAWMSLIQSRAANAYYLDPKGMPEQITAIQELGFVWVDGEIIPNDGERIFQTHEE